MFVRNRATRLLLLFFVCTVAFPSFSLLFCFLPFVVDNDVDAVTSSRDTVVHGRALFVLHWSRKKEESLHCRPPFCPVIDSGSTTRRDTSFWNLNIGLWYLLFRLLIPLLHHRIPLSFYLFRASVSWQLCRWLCCQMDAREPSPIIWGPTQKIQQDFPPIHLSSSSDK